MVEPPCDDAAAQQLATDGAHDADRIDAVMRIEAAVLDGDEGLRQVGRQFLQRQRGAAHVAARREHAAVRCRRSGSRAAAWEFPATGSAADARRPRPTTPMPAMTHPQREHERPIDEAAEAASRAARLRLLLLLGGGAGASSARTSRSRRVVALCRPPPCRPRRIVAATRRPASMRHANAGDLMGRLSMRAEAPAKRGPVQISYAPTEALVKRDAISRPWRPCALPARTARAARA